ncbi:hypothetical protein [Spirosoma utsteinense]|uniref:hypothetical protein n=1 Tax=Spirosoma utsteinense TaxID=2585773 RepID=UPI001644CEA2|nr:hypothetical protein [Spirosoma utsteinense]MBC3789300.1 hypothetical protein [Spirosoma utsteinense]
MKAHLLFLLYAISLSVSAQHKLYDVALSYGIYSAPTLKQSHSKDYFLVDFSYHLTKRWILTSGFTSGQFNYYDDIRSNADTEVTKYTTANTNARGYDFHTYAVIKYNIIALSRFRLQAGAGIGMLTQRLKYPYRQPCSSGCAVFIGEESSTVLEFPVRAEVYYLLTNWIGLGVTAGGFINPTSSNTGIHFGPQIRLNL